MPKGIPWTNQDEVKLKQLVQDGANLQAIALALGKSENSIYNKIKRLGLEEGIRGLTPSSSETILPAELPTSEQALIMLANALQAATEPGLSKVEVLRLQVVATLARAYDHLLANYIRYREIETKLIELDHKYDQLVQKMQSNAPQRNNATTDQPPTQ